MSKFNIGDRVVVTTREKGDPAIGTHGVAFDCGSGSLVLVRFDNWKDGHGVEGNMWWMRNEEMTKVIPSRRVTPSARRIETHLKKHGAISPAEALIVYGETRLARCIHELRENGAVIDTEMRKDERGKKYARYFAAA